MSLNSTSQPGEVVPTRERVLRAAVEVFAECGYHQATVRAICRRAGANVASVNYHFKSKDELYLEAVNSLYKETALPQHHQADLRTPADARLRMFIRDHLQALTGATAEGGLFAAIMTKEMTDPSPVFPQLLESCLQPRSQSLEDLLNELSGGRLQPFQLQACVMSVLGQCVVYHKAHKVMRMIHPDFFDEPELEDKLVEHIAAFSEAGLKAAVKGVSS